MFKQHKQKHRLLEKRVNINEKSLSKISMDIKHLHRSSDGYKYVLVLLCEVTNYLVTHPLKTTQTPEVCQALIKSFFAYFGTPRIIVTDLDPSFMSSLMKYFVQQFQIKLVTISVTNHSSLLAEMAIKQIGRKITINLTGKGLDWTKFLPWATLSFNIFPSPNLNKFCPLELLLAHKPKILPQYEVTPEVPVTGTFKDYITKLKKQISYLRDNIYKFRDIRQDLQNKDRTPIGYVTGQLVYMFNPRGARLQTGTRKIQCEWVGPLCIYKSLSPSQFLLMTITGCIIPHIIEMDRLKPGYLQSTKGVITHLSQLKSMLRAGIKLDV